MKLIYFLTWLFLSALFFPLSLVLFIRELGRLIISYILGLRVFGFVFGFGREVFSFNVFNVSYSFYLFPLGSYLEMDSPPEVLFQRNSLFKKSIVSIGGLITLFCFSILLSFSIFYFFKQLETSDKPVVGGVSEILPAKIAGLEIGDRIISINGELISTWDMLTDKVNQSDGKPLEIYYQRGEDKASLSIVPLYLEDMNKYIIGIRPIDEEVELGFSVAFVRSFQMLKLRILSYEKMFTKDIPETIIIPYAPTLTHNTNAFSNMIRINLFWFLDTSLFLLLISLIPIPFISDLGSFVFYVLQSLKLIPANFTYSSHANRIGLFVLPLFLLVFLFSGPFT